MHLTLDGASTLVESRTQETLEAPFFLITIDTEGDNIWSAPREVTTRNSGFLERFQHLWSSFTSNRRIL
jgi:hypothetical protein